MRRLDGARWQVVGRTRATRLQDGGAPAGTMPVYAVSAAQGGVRSRGGPLGRDLTGTRPDPPRRIRAHWTSTSTTGEPETEDMNLRIFGLSYAVTLVSLVVAFLYAGVTGLVLCAILGILEISLSFDNAVVNATVLERMSAFWQRIFLTIGVLIAVFGMRLVFPLLIVGITAQPQPDRGRPARAGAAAPERPHELRRAAQRRLPADRRVRRHVPADALPRLALRRPRHPLAVLAGEAAGQDRAAGRGCRS